MPPLREVLQATVTSGGGGGAGGLFAVYQGGQGTCCSPNKKHVRRGRETEEKTKEEIEKGVYTCACVGVGDGEGRGQRVRCK